MPDRIDAHEFIKLSAPPDRVRVLWDQRAKSGIDGVALWDCGTHGEEFTVTSEQMFDTYANARAKILDYKLLEEQGPVTIRYGNVDEPVQTIKVIRVRPTLCKAIIGKKGGDASTYLGLLIAEWTLLPIDPAVNPP